AFKIRLCGEVVHVPQTEVCYWYYAFGDVQHLMKRFLVENAHPADTDTFCPSRKPQILHGADYRIQSSFRHGEATESMPPFALRVAHDAEVLRRLQNAFELLTGISLPGISLVNRECRLLR